MKLRVIVLSAVVITAALLVHRRDSEREARTSQIQAELQQVRRSLRTERDPVTIVRYSSGESPPGAVGAARAGVGKSAAVATASVQDELTAEGMHDQLEAAFQRDAIDLAWASTSQQLAQERLAKLLPPTSTIRSIDCHGAMCRIETWHAGRDAYQEFFNRAFVDRSTMLWNGAVHNTLTAEGSGDAVSVVSFLSRENGELPKIE
jgi:hypothetical protein